MGNNGCTLTASLLSDTAKSIFSTLSWELSPLHPHNVSASFVYSILKKKREKDGKDNKPIELEYGKLSMRFIDRTIVNSD